nr:hypothetical protein [Myroides phaeus]
MSTESGKNELNHFTSKLISGAETNQATFEPISNFEKGVHTFSALYPHHESHGNDPKKVIVNLPSEQYQAETATNDNIANYSFFYATQKISVNNNNSSINFGLKNLFSILEFDFTLESPDQKISEITITSQNQNLAGDFTVDLTADKVIPQTGSNTAKSIT